MLSQHNHERGFVHPYEGARACAICGGWPVAIGCYHICENSIHYYSPERERYDDAWFGADGGYEVWMARRDAEMEAEVEAQYAADEDNPPFSEIYVGPEDA